MKVNPLISILVPMYNSESTIARCLSSLCLQESKNFEIVIVDDGSNDSGFDIVKLYESKYSYIHAFQQDNLGVGKTRQTLLQHANGKYIMFCDADDYLESNAINNVVNLLKKSVNDTPDLFIFGYNLIRSYGEKAVHKRKLSEGIHKKTEFSKHHIKGMSDLYFSVLWNKCYKKTLCESPEIKFQDKLEDVIFNLDYMSRCEKIFVSHFPIYNYVQIGSSLTRGRKEDNAQAIIEAYETCTNLYNKALLTYPNEKEIVAKHIYCRNNELIRRAHKIHGTETNFFLCLYERKWRIEKVIGVKIVPLKLQDYFNNIKRIIKHTVKSFLENKSLFIRTK